MMTAMFLLLVGAMVVALTSGIRHTAKVHQTVAKHVSKTHVSQAVTALLVTVQLSEVTRVLSHASMVHIILSILLLTVILAAKAGTEAELH
jgi:hypothetical protein